ncbi:MAG: carbohydrate ABC transporter permease [Gemmiger sp.]|uniref:carbohydrate ABC transporter permease n=1 Tax=Gemmiger sp. TaxID=2049027 RepID=UPI002E764107|nr:carbohydrate ABC transporter permease [Gemmiger sp.]MEE0801293.1 carbohydrate ABC transporter permease [Gemmiger sp.]
MIKRIFCAAALIALALFTWWVLWFMVMGALTTETELRATIGPALLTEPAGQSFWTVLPSWPTLQPLVQLLLDTPLFFTMFWNACQLAFPQILGQVAVAVPAAWVFSKLPFPGRRALYTVYLLLMILPFQITMVPNYLVLDRLSLMDTPGAVILPGIFSTFPVFITKKAFDAVPVSLLEAAAIDGAGPLRIFVRIGLPLGLPGVLSAVVLDFIEAWNAIEQPMMFLKDRNNWPLSLYLSNITAADLGPAMVASLMMLAPPLLLFLAGETYLEQGIGLSALSSKDDG